MKSGLKLKALIVLLVSLMIILASTMCFATEQPTLNSTETSTEEKEDTTPRLNSKVYFTGKTYSLPNINWVRKDYGEGEGCGIISIISRSAKHPVYVSGEGWINADQIVKIEDYITLKFDREEGLSSTFKINGEFLNVESTNNAVMDYQNGELAIKGNGTAQVNITTKDGENIEALATVVDNEVTLNIPEGKVTGEISAEAGVADKVKVETEGNAAIELNIDEEGVGVAAEGNGGIKLEADEKEIVSAEGTGSASASAGINGASAGASGSQSLSLLERLTLKLTGRAEASASKEEAAASAAGDITLNDKEIVSGEVETSHDFQENEQEPEENTSVDTQRVPVLSFFEKLLSKIAAR